MGDWYSIGILVGLGTSIGVATVAALARALPALVVAGAIAAVDRLPRLRQWDEAVGGLVGAACGTLGVGPIVTGALRRGGTRGGTAVLLGLVALVGAALAFVPVLGYLEALAVPLLGARLRRRSPDRHAGLRVLCARLKPVVLVVIDGLTPSMFEAADTPAIRFLAEHGTYRRATSTFPSLTPVCLSSIATGSHPDVHEIPHLVWWHRGEQRIVEYGSSFGAVRAAGIARSLRDTVDRPQRAPPEPPRRDDLRGARGDRPDRRRDQHHLLPRHPSPSADHPRRPGGLRPEALLLLLPLRERQDRRPDRRAQPRARVDRRVRGLRRPLARHPRRVRLPRLLPPRLRLRLARRPARTARTRRSRAATPPSQR